MQLNREPLLATANPLLVHQKPAYSDHPVDYFVPDFGLAHETQYTLNNIKKTEKKLKHKLNFMNDKPDPKDEYPMNYKVANFGQDPEITTTLSNMRAAEDRLDTKFTVTKESVPVGSWEAL